MAADMTLEVWKSDFLLPSVDYKCLQFMVCARVCAAPVKVVQCVAPWNSPTGQYPVFKHGTTKVITDFKNFRAHLKKQVPDLPIDGHLDNNQLCEIASYEAFLEQSLYPAYIHALWVDEYNSSCMTNRWYGKQLVFPYGLYYGLKMKTRAKNYLRSIYGGNLTTDNCIEIGVTKKALQCINLLSAKLGEKKYFLGGNRPTSLDALVFGYLAPLLRLPLPNDRLQIHIKGCPNLVRFVDSIINVYLPFTEGEITMQQESLKIWEKRRMAVQHEIRQKAAAKAEATDANEYPMRDKILFGITAAVLSLLFALHLGLIQFEIRPVEDTPRRKSRNQKAPESLTFTQRNGDV